VKATQAGNKPQLKKDAQGNLLVPLNDPEKAKEILQTALKSLKGYTFRCKGCGKIEESDQVPPNWFSVAIHKPFVHGDTTFDWKRLGLFCSVGCVENQIPRFYDESEEAEPASSAETKL